MITKVLIRFDKLHGETPRAVLLKIQGTEYWFPKRFCWNFILNSKLGGNMVIPTWLYKEKFGEEPPEEYAAVIVEKHIPERIEPKNTIPDADLTR